jgi:hypothetical protein
MFKLKLWLTPLLCLLTGSALLFVGTTTLHGILMPAFDEEMKVLRVGVRGSIKSDISDAISATLALADKPEVRQSVGLVGDPAAAPVDLLAKGAGRLSAPGFALVADATGKVVKKAGDAQGLGDSIAGLPVFAEALTGVMRDGFLRLGDAPYVVIAAPIAKDRTAVGVVVLGFPLDAAYIDTIGADAGFEAVLVDRSSRAGSGLAGFTADDLKLAVAEDTIGEPVVTLPVPLPLPLPLFVPDTKRYLASGVAFYPGTGAPTVVLAIDRNDAFNALALLQLYVGGATLLLALLLSTLVLSILSSISRPMDVLMEHLGAFAQGGQVGILPETALQGPFVRLGKQINMILQAPSLGAPRSGQSPIAPVGPLNFSGSGSFPVSDSGANAGMFGQAPTSSPGVGDDELRFEGIPGLDTNAAAAPPLSGGFNAARLTPPTPPSSTPTANIGLPGFGASKSPIPPLPGDAFGAPTPPPSADGLSTGLSGLFDDAGPDPLSAFRVGAKPAKSPPPPPPENAYNPDATVMFQVPQELIQESAATSQTGAPISSFANMAPTGGGDERTVVAQVPAELINRSVAPAGAVPSADDQHYRQVFREFLDVRQQCGEDTDSLTYEKFLQKLMKNRDQIIEKYNSKSVRFQVYVKAGKAALRAVPVRD